MIKIDPSKCSKDYICIDECAYGFMYGKDEVRRGMLYRVQKGDIPRVGRVMADAFQRDPLWNKICEGESDFEKRFRALFEVPVRFCLRYGEVYAPSKGKFDRIESRNY